MVVVILPFFGGGGEEWGSSLGVYIGGREGGRESGLFIYPSRFYCKAFITKGQGQGPFKSVIDCFLN